MSEVRPTAARVKVAVKGRLADHINRRSRTLSFFLESADFGFPDLGLSMQEDLQPNETRLQRKGDHHVPRVQSSATMGHFHHRTRPLHKTKKPQRWKKRHRDHNETFTGTSDNSFGQQGSSRTQGLSLPPPRDLDPSTRDKWAINRRPAVSTVSTSKCAGQSLRSH